MLLHYFSAKRTLGILTPHSRLFAMRSGGGKPNEKSVLDPGHLTWLDVTLNCRVALVHLEHRGILVRTPNKKLSSPQPSKVVAYNVCISCRRD